MRDEGLDILRFVGIAMVILAHVDPPSFVFQLRNFDVPLMVLVAGASFSISYKNEPYVAYMWKRLNRLLFPTWIFLTAYFLALFVMFTMGYLRQLPNARTIVTSYLMLSGIGYVWIIRVFLLVAVVSPAIFKFERGATHPVYFSILACVYIVYELLLFATKPYFGSVEGYLLESTALYVLPYAVVFAIGLRLPRLSNNQVLSLTVTAFVVFAVCGILLFVKSGRLFPTQAFKYPPSIYYLSYSIGVSGALWLASRMVLTVTKQTAFSRIVFHVARNGIWVYLWHIPFITIFQTPYYLKYPLVFVLAFVMAIIQVQFVNRILLPSIGNLSVRRNVKTLLTG